MLEILKNIHMLCTGIVFLLERDFTRFFVVITILKCLYQIETYCLKMNICKSVCFKLLLLVINWSNTLLSRSNQTHYPTDETLGLGFWLWLLKKYGFELKNIQIYKNIKKKEIEHIFKWLEVYGKWARRESGNIKRTLVKM